MIFKIAGIFIQIVKIVDVYHGRSEKNLGLGNVDKLVDKNKSNKNNNKGSIFKNN
jgi:hypothetical protein